ncbi:MAG: flagellar hook-basal body protein [Epulopiscium sp.]|jgi:flagellar basal-body rod protein FlgG|nr:flagellar hook-basal body protein [Candidatus Epulonipiscium sp.]
MDMSFYTAAVGASAHQSKLDVVSNNLANANTYGFKARKPVFTDLLYSNMNAAEGSDSNLKAGSGIRLEKTDINLEQGALDFTGGELDFAIIGSGFFGLINPETKEVTYTREGSFRLSQVGNDFYLASATGKWVMGADKNPIVVKKAGSVEEDDEGVFFNTSGSEMEDILKQIVDEIEREMDDGKKLNIGLFDFANTNGLQNVGSNEYIPVGKNGEPITIEATQENVYRGALEHSNVDIADQFAKVIEAQRAYQYALRMVQTSDETVATINALRTS